MTRTGALVWKEWRDHRASVLVFAALVPLISWPVQRWIFRFGEPEWTWAVLLPICLGLALAVVASDLFAMDLATSRMASFAALPVGVRRHFGARAAYLAMVAAALGAWIVVVNLVVVAGWGKEGAVWTLLDENATTACGVGLCVTLAATASVVLLSAMGVGGLRAVLGGIVVAALAFAATTFTARILFPPEWYWSNRPQVFTARNALEWLVAGGVTALAGYAAFVGGRAHAVSRRRGAAWMAAVLVPGLVVPAGAAGWSTWRSFVIEPGETGEEITLQGPLVSPDGRYVAISASKVAAVGQVWRTWVVRIADGKLFDWPRFNEMTGGWSDDGLVWMASFRTGPGDPDYGRLAHPETGDTVTKISPDDWRDLVNGRLIQASGCGPGWSRWFRFDNEPVPGAAKGVSKWRLWVKDSELQRTVEARWMPCAMPTPGEALVIDADNRLTRVRFAGGEPEVLAADVVSMSGWLAASPTGRYVIVKTSAGVEALDTATWQCAAGPYAKSDAYWVQDCSSRDVFAAMAIDGDGQTTHLVDAPSGREIALDPALVVTNPYQNVKALPDGGFVVRTTAGEMHALDANGHAIRKLYPPDK